MDLRALVEKNLRLTLEGDFGMRVNLIAPDGIKDTMAVDGRPLKGQVLHSITRDGEQMNGLIGRITVDVPVVTLRRSSLRRVPFPGENWIVEIPDTPIPGAPMIQYALSSTRTPEGGKSMGTIRLYLQYVEQVLALYADDLVTNSDLSPGEFIDPVYGDDLATDSVLDAGELIPPPPTELPDYSIASESSIEDADATGVLVTDSLDGGDSTLDNSNPEAVGVLSSDSLVTSTTLDAADLDVIGDLDAADLASTTMLGTADLVAIGVLSGADLASTGATSSADLAGIIAGDALTGSSSAGLAGAVGALSGADLAGAGTLSAGNGSVALPANDLASTGTVTAGPWAPSSTINFVFPGDLAANSMAGSGTISSGAWAPTSSIVFSNFTGAAPVSTIGFTNFS